MRTDCDQRKRVDAIVPGICICGAKLKTGEVHVCAKCAGLLLEGESIGRARSEKDG